MKRAERQLSRAMKGEFRRLAKDILLAMLPTYLEMHGNVQVDNTLVMDAHRLAEQMYDHPPRKLRAHEYGDMKSKILPIGDRPDGENANFQHRHRTQVQAPLTNAEAEWHREQVIAEDGDVSHDGHCEFMMGDGPCDCGAVVHDEPEHPRAHDVIRRSLDRRVSEDGINRGRRKGPRRAATAREQPTMSLQEAEVADEHPRDHERTDSEDGHTNTESPRTEVSRSGIERRVSMASVSDKTTYVHKGRRKYDRRGIDRLLFPS